MNLDKQIQLLIDNAPQDGVTPGIVAAVAPVLKLLASQFRHQYYILQNLEQQWVVTTLESRANPNIEKRVVYAFPSLQDISVGSAGLDPQVVAVPIPVTHVLFQLFALETVDSIIFLEATSDLSNGVEIRREDLQNLIQVQLQQNPSTRPTSPNQFPPDIA